ncbi:MAG TPA: hypothetical protein VFJ16_14075 [Longimicrobium sp.]|nr:hypothetical protein [Longimicrobium sp.]
MDECVRYDERLGVIVITPPERVSHHVLDEYRARMVALPQFNPRVPVVVDWTRIDHSMLTAELVRDRARNPWPVTSRIAFYAPGNVLFGLARMYSLQSSQQIEAFRDCGQALAWVTADAA